MKKLILFPVTILFITIIQAQNVGIGTTTPHSTARLHVELGTSMTDGFLVTGTASTSASVPDLGPGSRMMYYPAKAAFRAGTTTGLEWNNANIGQHSAAFGYSTKASNYTSFAAGYFAQASGFKSLSIGDSTRASGVSSVALGAKTWASGDASTAIGYA